MTMTPESWMLAMLVICYVALLVAILTNDDNFSA